MKRWEAWTVHVSMLLVTGTGVVYAWMRYLATPIDPYAVVRHPLQPLLQHLHVLVAPALVFAVGIIWREHVWGHFTNGVPKRRRSGLMLLLGLLPMVVSGYLIQTTVDEPWRRAWVIVHVTTSTLFVLGYAGHALSAVSAWLRRRRVAAALPDELAARAARR